MNFRCFGHIYWLYLDSAEGFKLGLHIGGDGEIGFFDSVLAGSVLQYRDVGYRWISHDA
jgi:hypothetical protein